MNTVVEEFVRFASAESGDVLDTAARALQGQGFSVVAAGEDRLVATRGERPAPTPDLVPVRAEVRVVPDGAGVVLRASVRDDAGVVVTGPARRNYERLVGEVARGLDAALGSAALGSGLATSA